MRPLRQLTGTTMTSNREIDPVTAGRFSTRRQWLQLCGGAGVVGLAGCLGDDSDQESEDDAEHGNSPEGEDDPEAGDDPESVVLGPEDGWKAAHEGVEVPDERGTAILYIGGERVELSVFGNAVENPDGTGTTGAEVFEATGAAQDDQFQGSGISVEFQRVLGFEATTANTWAESDSISFARRDATSLGNVIFRQYEDGTLVDADEAGELEGRRFVEESFLRITTEGVVTAVEELVSHEDDSLNGQFELGARLQDGWNR